MISHVFLYILSLNSIWFGLTEFGVSLKEIISKRFSFKRIFDLSYNFDSRFIEDIVMI